MNHVSRRVAAAFGFVLLAAAPYRADAPYESPQRLVAVGHERRLNIYCSGPGSPTVVLDAAIGSSMYVWHQVQPALSQHVRVCSYDRSGYGFSDPGGLPHTTSANVSDLHALLTNARIEPPYILVAHSLNAFDARLFADRYPDEVAGMVLLDPSEVGENRFAAIYGKKKYDAERAADLKYIQVCDQKAHRRELKLGDNCVGPANPHAPKVLQRVQQQHDLSEGMWDATLSEMISLAADIHEVASEQRSYGNLPFFVLTAGAAEQDAAGQTGAGKAQIAAANRLWKRLRDADAALSHRGVNCIIPGASHYLQIEKPNIVVEALLQIARDSRRPGIKPSCAQLR